MNEAKVRIAPTLSVSLVTQTVTTSGELLELPGPASLRVDRTASSTIVGLPHQNPRAAPTGPEFVLCDFPLTERAARNLGPSSDLSSGRVSRKEEAR